MRSRSALLMITLSLAYPHGIFDSPYVTDRIRIATDGYVYAPTKPGLGYQIDYHIFDKLTKRVETQSLATAGLLCNSHDFWCRR
jgi:L-alanine-DL-glutamate epimerase-like enolase superfamily enzyme